MSVSNVSEHDLIKQHAERLDEIIQNLFALLKTTVQTIDTISDGRVRDRLMQDAEEVRGRLFLASAELVNAVPGQNCGSPARSAPGGTMFPGSMKSSGGVSVGAEIEQEGVVIPFRARQ
jgi:hypothetical protein